MIRGMEERCVLNNGVEMPCLGLGLAKIKKTEQIDDIVRNALTTGYRSLDTAEIYGNEMLVGQAVKRYGIPRRELFITTKLWNKNATYDRTIAACELSLQRLGMDYIDLYLIHWPIKGQYQEVWEAFIELQKQGKVRAIGVCSFQIHHLQELLSASNIIPAINQVEFHPLLTQEPLLAFCKKHHIQVEAWSPLMQGNFRFIPKLSEIALLYGKSVPQIILRWNLQKGVITIPKSTRSEHLTENTDIFDFHLSQEHMLAIDALNLNQRFGEDPDQFRFRD
ncbi:aldo/keto reductase [Paenibacillus enshidis]|uniref:Aldo/keto reductase n=1 Tax=Paenibacillus enshidis TaxID=1458439 RepID=A0ABV5AXY6_9BACL